MGAVEKGIEILDPEALLQGMSMPAVSTPIDVLYGQYLREKADLERISSYITGDAACGVMHHFMVGAQRERGYASLTAADLFKLDPALLSLDCAYWQRAIDLTDVFEVMPAKRRNEWTEMIRHGFVEMEDGEADWRGVRKKIRQRIPPFDLDTVRNTMFDLLGQRQQFFVERVDGLFRGLSQEHLTNRPEGFSKRMIINRVLNEYGHLGYEKANVIHDLRVVIARFMGRDVPPCSATHSSLSSIAHDVKRGDSGVWHSFDGGAFRIKVYQVGTAHFEVHPDMAWRLNAVLAHLYPSAIPSEFRTKPKKPSKSFQLVHDLVPFEVIGQLTEGRLSNEGKTLSFSTLSKPLTDAAKRVIQFLGGVPVGLNTYEFGYPFGEVLSYLCRTGMLPEQKSHQYYPTPPIIAERVVDLADIEPGMLVLEPSAGQGGIADFLNPSDTTCVEISPLHCKVLESKGFRVVCQDFMACHPDRPFDRIVMNPPFSEGRAIDHLRKAADLLKSGGVLVAVLPASQSGKHLLEGFEHQWCGTYEGEFKGTGIAVSLLRLVKP